MTATKLLAPALLVAALTAAGCGDSTSAPSPAKEKEKLAEKKKDDKHAHGAGPNDGVVFDFGKEHAEFTVDHAKKECTVLMLDGDNAQAVPLPVAATELTLSIKASKVKEGADKGKPVPAMTITLKPVDVKDGKASKFVGTDPGLANVADFEGTVLGEIDGKPSKGEFKE